MAKTKTAPPELVGPLPPIRESKDYVGRKIYGRVGTESEADAGTITSVGHCTLGGCGGLRLYVTWPDGSKTRPCTKGCTYLDNGHMRIG